MSDELPLATAARRLRGIPGYPGRPGRPRKHPESAPANGHVSGQAAGSVMQPGAVTSENGCGGSAGARQAPVVALERPSGDVVRVGPALLSVRDAGRYLGLSPRQLRGELRSGQSLAQIADGLGGGRSAAGLKDALLAAARARLTAAVSAGRLTKARAAVIGSRLQRRLTVLLSRRRHKR